jgi:hypothetical protein
MIGNINKNEVVALIYVLTKLQERNESLQNPTYNHLKEKLKRLQPTSNEQVQTVE